MEVSLLPVALAVGVVIGFWLRSKIAMHNVEHAHARRRERLSWRCPWCTQENPVAHRVCQCGWWR